LLRNAIQELSGLFGRPIPLSGFTCLLRSFFSVFAAFKPVWAFMLNALLPLDLEHFIRATREDLDDLIVS